MVCLSDDERIGINDKVLVVLTNQYMFEQLLWYYSKYPEGVWEAVIIRFGSNDLLDIMYQKCRECGFFSKIVCYNHGMIESSLSEKMLTMMKYIFQYITRTREKWDRKFIEGLMGEDCCYKKVIIQSTYNVISVASVNAMPEAVLVCLEDGLGDYMPVSGIKYHLKLLNLLLVKMNIVNALVYDYQFRLKCDNRLIKYCSLPEKMKYRGFKLMKQLFEDDNRKKIFSEKELLLKKRGYDLVIFSTIFSDFHINEDIKEILHIWLLQNYGDKKILLKPHPRDSYQYCWKDLDIDIGGEEMAGEVLLDLLPDVEVLFLYTTTILLKACKEKRNFKVIQFNNIKSKWYRLNLKNCSEVLGLQEGDWIVLDGEKNE